MRSPLARGLVALAAVAAVVVLFVVLAGGDDGGEDESTMQAQSATGSTGATGTTGAAGEQNPAKQQVDVPRIVVVGGKPRGGVERLSFESGDRIRFTVNSDVADEVHVHGYDVTEDVPAGGSVRFSFPARIEGVFEVEFEGLGQQIAELRVSPG
jgi:hypothetical protein